LTFVLLAGFNQPTLAQRIKGEVVFHVERLPLEEQQYLEGLDSELTRLMDDYPWTGGAHSYEYELPVQVELFFDKYSRSASYHRYTAKVLVELRSGIQLRDTRWEFRIHRDDRLYLGEPYNTFTGLIEFYTWICLGFEADSMAPLGGQPYYEKARLISEQARFETRYYTGWDYRRELARDLTQDTTYRNIRTAAYHAAVGIYYVEQGELESGRSHLTRAAELAMTGSCELLELHRNDHIIRFIEIGRFAAALEQVGEQKLLDRMARWDPENADIYR